MGGRALARNETDAERHERQAGALVAVVQAVALQSVKIGRAHV